MSRSSGRTERVLERALDAYQRARARGVMHLEPTARRGKYLRLPDGREVCEFVSCSYLGLDAEPRILAAARTALDQWGAHICCARTRLSIAPNVELERRLSLLFGGRAVTFPSVTAAHASVLPLVASGVLIERRSPAPRTCLMFDRYAHASMQSLRPALAGDARLVTLPHNDLDALEAAAVLAARRGEVPVFVGDGVYSMGGAAPVRELLDLAGRRGIYLYLDDAHGTGIFGNRGQGYVLDETYPTYPPNLFLPFSLAKGFGCNGGGVVVPEPWQEERIRFFGQGYAFSGPLDFAMMGAALAALDLEAEGELSARRTLLWQRVAQFDGGSEDATARRSPIRMVEIGEVDDAIERCARLLDAGYYLSAVFYPVVPEGRAQLRVVLTAAHSAADVEGLKAAQAGLPP